MSNLKSAAVGNGLFVVTIFGLATYFTFAAVQGDFGLFNRIQIEAERALLLQERDALEIRVAEMQNKTRRLSDEFLDLDLLDEQARDVLGLVRSDEIVLN